MQDCFRVELPGVQLVKHFDKFDKLCVMQVSSVADYSMAVAL